jgi:catechol 2,3-dioxygenase-like lactoylglutathione lyase family enzyme
VQHIFRKILLAFVAVCLIAGPARAQDKGTARFDRTALVIKDMYASMAFWRDIMKFEVVIEPVILPKAENKAIGWSDQADVRFARLQSPQGAGIALLEVKQDGYHDLEIAYKPVAYGGVVLVFEAKDIDALYQRALKAGAVAKHLGASPSGKSKQMNLRAPSGHLLEIYEFNPEKPEW